MRTRVLLLLAAVLAVTVSTGAGTAATTPISGTFTSTDCGGGHAATVPEKSTLEVAVTLSDRDAAIEIELRGPFGDVTRSDGFPSAGGAWRRDVFSAGTYTIRICPKQRAPSDPPVTYTGSIVTSATGAVPAAPKGASIIHSKQDTRATLVRSVSGSGAVATPRGVATFSVRTVKGAVRLTYTDRKAGIRIRPGAKIRATYGPTSVTVHAGGVSVMLIDRGTRLDRVVAKARGYRVAGNLVRGGVTVH